MGHFGTLKNNENITRWYGTFGTSNKSYENIIFKLKNNLQKLFMF